MLLCCFVGSIDLCSSIALPVRFFCLLVDFDFSLPYGCSRIKHASVCSPLPVSLMAAPASPSFCPHLSRSTCHACQPRTLRPSSSSALELEATLHCASPGKCSVRASPCQESPFPGGDSLPKTGGKSEGNAGTFNPLCCLLKRRFYRSIHSQTRSTTPALVAVTKSRAQVS